MRPAPRARDASEGGGAGAAAWSRRRSPDQRSGWSGSAGSAVDVVVEVESDNFGGHVVVEVMAGSDEAGDVLVTLVAVEAIAESKGGVVFFVHVLLLVCGGAESGAPRQVPGVVLEYDVPNLGEPFRGALQDERDRAVPAMIAIGQVVVEYVGESRGVVLELQGVLFVRGECHRRSLRLGLARRFRGGAFTETTPPERRGGANEREWSSVPILGLLARCSRRVLGGVA